MSSSGVYGSSRRINQDPSNFAIAACLAEDMYYGMAVGTGVAEGTTMGGASVTYADEQSLDS